jgi:23S rRNA pseudouridine1911/1915/1917 synthase
VLPGGKVSEDALRAALEKASEDGAEDDEGLRRVRFELRRDLQKRLDKYLTDRIAFLSRTQLQRLIDEGGVTVNGRRPKASTVLRIEDVVEVVIPAPPPKNVQPEDIPLDVMFEDEHLLVVNKQPDIIVHPARTHLKGTMLSALAYHFMHRSTVGGALSTVGGEFARPGVVHRLDRHTSGCIVFAKRDEVHWQLGRQFEVRTVEKRYLALVHGHYSPDRDVIDLPLGPHPSREKGYREKCVVRHDELGKPAVTIVHVRERYTIGREVTGRYSLVELDLKTGRTHQIRVHLSHSGYPIIGDDMYGGRAYEGEVAGGGGGKADADGPAVLARQALHACTLAFTHPMTGERLRFTAPLRGDIGAVVADLRARGNPERVESPGATIDLGRAVV